MASSRDSGHVGTRPRRWVPISTGLLSVALVGAGTAGGGLTASAAPASPAASSADWTVYHGDPLGSGTAKGTVDLRDPHKAWTSPTLTGELYGEPLVSGSLVYVATTADVVYALHAKDGTVAWHTTVGIPEPATALPCGNIAPTVGIVGTPVIDPTRHELYAVADESIGGHASHHLVGLDTTTGKVVLDQGVDPAGSTPVTQLQRTGLALADGRVVFGMGGNYGDCGSYHGWLISVPEAGGTAKHFEVNRQAGETQGAIWMGGAAPVVDATGHVWVATGNGSVTSGAPHSGDSVLELTATMDRLQSFTPGTWPNQNLHDLDLGSSAPALLPDGHIVQVGKSQTAYILDRTHLGGIGGQQAQHTGLCGNDFDGGTSFVGSTVYLPCYDGPIAATVTANPVGLHIDWRTTIANAGPTIVAGGYIWTIDKQGQLDALSPRNGAVVKTLTVGTIATSFPTPAVGDGLLLAPAATDVVAFSG